MNRITIDDYKKIIMANTTASDKKQNIQTDFLPLQGTDYVEFYVGNAKQAASLLYECFWFPGIGLCRA
jgi:4-hydroxyphenylpyruvate dioxygenase